MGVHPRLSVNSLSSLFFSLDEDLAMWRALGVEHVGLISPKLAAAGWDAAARAVRDARLRVSNISTESEVLGESIRFAATVGAETVYVCSGRGDPTWDRAAAAFCARIDPFASLAERLGVRLAVEPTNPLRADVSFVFSLRDAFDLARDAGIGVVVDLYSCWYERGLAALVAEHVDSIALVQVCDYVLGTFDTPNRAVPGDGAIPLGRLISTLTRTGYTGAFDLEILGPRIEAEGYGSAVRRGVEQVSAVLTELGIPK